MRDSDTIQRAHDTLVGIALGEVEVRGLDPEEPRLIGALDALCWVLEHEHNTAFADNLRKLRAAFAAAGIVEREA